MGLFDQNIQGFAFDDYYGALAERLGQATKRNGEYAPVFGLTRPCARSSPENPSWACA